MIHQQVGLRRKLCLFYTKGVEGQKVRAYLGFRSAERFLWYVVRPRSKCGRTFQCYLANAN